MALLALVPDFVKLPVAILLGAAIAFYPVKWYGASEEKHRAEVASLAKTVEIVRGRQTTDAIVAFGDAASVCNSLGLRDQAAIAECMRRVGANDTVVKHVGDDNSDGSPVCKPGSVTQQVRSPARLLEGIGQLVAPAAH